MKNSTPKLSVVIPCYNEELNISHLLKKLDSLPNLYSNIEILLVNNGSTDNSEQVMLEEISKRNHDVFKYVKVFKNEGYGFGILSGLEKASGDILAWTHADLQTDPQDLIKGMNLLLNQQEEKVIVKGKRFGRPLSDQFFTKMMEIYTNFTLQSSLNDINAQPKFFSRRFYEEHIKGMAPYDFSLDLFLLLEAEKEGYQILQFPVVFEIRQFGEAKGGGSLKLKYKLTKRTINYIHQLRNAKRLSL